VLVEGALDAEAVRRASNGLVPLALCGTAVTAGYLQQLRNIDPAAAARLINATNADPAVRGAICRLWSLLDAVEAATVRAAVLEAGAGPADLAQAGQRAELWAGLVEDARPMVQAAIDVTLARYDLEHVEGVLAGLRHVAEAIGTSTPAVLAQATGCLAKHLAATPITTSWSGRSSAPPLVDGPEGGTRVNRDFAGTWVHLRPPAGRGDAARDRRGPRTPSAWLAWPRMVSQVASPHLAYWHLRASMRFVPRRG